MVSGYASVIGVFANARDFKLQFRDTIPTVDQDGNITGQTVSFDEMIALTPTVAKELAIILTGQVDAYERQYGEIKTFLNQPENPKEANE